MAKQKPVDELTYEEAFAELEAIVASLEAGDQALDEAVETFSRGQALIKHCAGLLEKAELKVRELSEGHPEEPEEAE